MALNHCDAGMAFWLQDDFIVASGHRAGGMSC